MVANIAVLTLNSDSIQNSGFVLSVACKPRLSQKLWFSSTSWRIFFSFHILYFYTWVPQCTHLAAHQRFTGLWWNQSCSPQKSFCCSGRNAVVSCRLNWFWALSVVFCMKMSRAIAAIISASTGRVNNHWQGFYPWTFLSFSVCTFGGLISVQPW